jgi:uncharacterized protein YndB with AHSA1/START domain
MAQTHSLKLTRRLKAPAPKVYAAWTEADKMMRWFCPAKFEVVTAEADPRVGGRFRVLMRSPEGTEHDARGEYREVVPNEKLVFTWAWVSEPEWDSQVTILLAADGAATDLTLIHEKLPTESSRDGHREGWTGALENLAAIFE